MSVARPGQGHPISAETTNPSSPRRPHWVRISLVLRPLVGLAVGVILLGLWSLLARSLSADLLPGPVAVWNRFVESVHDGTYLPALGTTLEEALVGWVVATVVALPLGYLVGRFRSLESTLAPYLAGSQAMPVVAIAPLLVVWVGFGLLPKVIVCALIAFFPILATMAAGVRSVPRELVDAARVSQVPEWAVIWYVEIPLAARSMFAGLKVAAALAVTGAVVGEFVSADQGLGYLIMFGRTNFDTPLMFVALLSLVGLGASAYLLVSLVERWVLRWDT